MEPLVIAALISCMGIVTAAVIGRLRNGAAKNPPDPDKALIGQVSVGWFMDEFEERMADAVAEGLKRERERR